MGIDWVPGSAPNGKAIPREVSEGICEPLGSGESPGHGRDHGEVDPGFVVVGSGLVVGHAAAVLVDPTRNFSRPPKLRGRRWKPVAPGRRLMICIVRVRTSLAQMSNRPE